MEEGDWFLIQYNDYKSGYSSPKLCEFFENNPNNVLILSFSRCLEWLRERDWYATLFNYHKEIGGAMVEMAYIKKAEKVKRVRIDAKTHHEAIAKVCIRILEEENAHNYSLADSDISR